MVVTGRAEWSAQMFMKTLQTLLFILFFWWLAIDFFLWWWWIMHREVIWRRLKGLVGWIRDFKAGYRLHMMVHMLLFLGKTDANFGYHWNLGSGRAGCVKISVKVDNSGLLPEFSYWAFLLGRNWYMPIFVRHGYFRWVTVVLESCFQAPVAESVATQISLHVVVGYQRQGVCVGLEKKSISATWFWGKFCLKHKG